MQKLEPVWMAIMDVYDSYASVCKAHGFRHWVAYGTLLGAVRHKGFIPWDDDFDVFMPRDDYERFLKVAETELPAFLKIVKWRNTKEYNYAFSKVQDSRRDVYNCVVRESGTEQPQGIYIDVFPIDGVAPTNVGRMWERFARTCAYSRETYLFRKGAHAGLKGWLGEGVGAVFNLFGRGLKTPKDFDRYREQLARRYEFEGSERCGFYFTLQGGWEWTARTSVFDETVMLPFMDRQVPAPKGWHEFLTNMYGDYMTPPPESERKSVHWGEAPWKFGPTGL